MLKPADNTHSDSNVSNHMQVILTQLLVSELDKSSSGFFRQPLFSIMKTNNNYVLCRKKVLRSRP